MVEGLVIGQVDVGHGFVLTLVVLLTLVALVTFLEGFVCASF